MIDEKFFEEGKKILRNKSLKRINDLGYEMCIASTNTDEGPGIVAIIYGGKVDKMTEKDRLNLEVNLPVEVIVNSGIYSVPNPTFPVRISYIKSSKN